MILKRGMKDATSDFTHDTRQGYVPEMIFGAPDPMTEMSRGLEWNTITYRLSYNLSDNNTHLGVEWNCLLLLASSSIGMIDESLTSWILRRRKAIPSLAVGV